MLRVIDEWVALSTIVTKEIRRFMRIWLQTLLPPAMTMALYFIVFGELIGPRLGQMSGIDYIQYIVPGLIMMSVITNSYSNVASSFFSSKFQHCIEELLVAPVSNLTILLGYVAGGVVRGLLVGAVVTLLSLAFTRFPIVNIGATFVVLVLTATLFAIGGFINGVLAKKFDDIAIIPTFVLTPLTYLGGVFYSIDLLPEFWQGVSLLNPIVYMVNGFRYGLLGISDVPILHSIAMIMLFNIALLAFAWWMLKRGVGIKQ